MFGGGGIFNSTKNNDIKAATGTFTINLKHGDVMAAGLVDGGGKILVYQWTQYPQYEISIDGISNDPENPTLVSSSTTFSFTAPEVDEETKLHYREGLVFKVLCDPGYVVNTNNLNDAGSFLPNVADWAEFSYMYAPYQSTSFTLDIEFTEESWANNYASTSTWKGEGTQDSPYLISNESELALLAKNVNSSTKNTYSGKYFKQTADLDMGAHIWDPIGYSSSYCFKGQYDGNGYKISGLNTIYLGSGAVLHNKASNKGLFGYVDANINTTGLTNITVVDSNFSGVGNIGGIVGYLRGGYETSLTNCKTKNVIIEATGNNAGGIVGELNDNDAGYFVLKDCSSSGEVKGKNNVGGIVGNSSYNGGGCINTCIERCENHCNVIGNDNVGGIIGNGYMQHINNSISKGIIKASGLNLGGIIGKHKNSGENLDDIKNSAVYGSLIGYAYAGTFVGNMDLSTYYTNYTLKISNCSFNGNAISGIDNYYSYSNKVAVTLSGCIVDNKEKKYYSEGNFNGYTVVNNMNDGIPMQNSLFSIAVGGQTSDYVINYLKSEGFKLVKI